MSDDRQHYPGMEGVEYCPVSIGARLVGDRWSLLIVRELLVGATRFNEIQRGLPGVSRSLLSGRLRSLERQGLVEHQTDTATGSYRLTKAGEDLRPVIVALGSWTVRWRFPPPSLATPDSSLLLWRMYQGLNLDKLPPHRVTLELDFDDAEPNRGWIILDGDASSLCMEPPGHDADLIVDGSVRAWLDVWYGFRGYADVVEAGDLILKGPPHLASQLRGWFDGSAFASEIAERRPACPPAED